MGGAGGGTKLALAKPKAISPRRAGYPGGRTPSSDNIPAASPPRFLFSPGFSPIRPTPASKVQREGFGLPSNPGRAQTCAQLCPEMPPSHPQSTHVPRRPKAGAAASRADRLRLTLMSRSRGRRPILGSSGSLGHRPERLGPLDIPEERAPVAGGVSGWAPLLPPGRARRALALPFLRKSGSRLALARPEPASPPPPPPWSAQPLASAPRPLSAASLPSLSPSPLHFSPSSVLRPSAPSPPPCPLLFPGPAPSALAALTPFPCAPVCSNRRDSLAAVVAAAV